MKVYGFLSKFRAKLTVEGNGKFASFGGFYYVPTQHRSYSAGNTFEIGNHSKNSSFMKRSMNNVL